jgi:DNA polymerase (family 10)
MADPIDRDAIAARLREIAAYLRLEKEPYRARAYERGAAVLEATPDFEPLLRAGRLEDLPGIGESLAGAIQELAARGTIPLLDRLRSHWPRGFAELLRIPGLGTRRTRQLHRALEIESVADLESACRAGRVRTVPGFGERSERALLEAVSRPSQPPKRTSLRLVEVPALVEPLLAWLRSAPGVVAALPAGEARRWLETVDSIELAVSTRDPAAALAWASRHPLVSSLALEEPGSASGWLVSGVPFRLHLGEPERFGLVWVRATGSPVHWEALRARAAAHRIPLEQLAAPDEQAVYSALGLPWLPPEVRDGTDELEAAAAGCFRQPLLEESDIRGAVHCHTSYSDGADSVEAMARAAEELGLGYLTITDHSQSARYARGLSLDRLRRQWDEIDEVQPHTRVRLLKGSESDILADGGLDWPDAVLEKLDVVIASIHQRHRQNEAQMTSRLLRAMRLPVFKIWGHPLGRLLLRRDPIACRLEEVLDAIAGSPAAIELNGDPYRLDLAPDLARRARARGIRFVVSSDAHSTRGLRAFRYGVQMARRARLTPNDVLNCLPADAFAAAVRPAGEGRAAPPGAAHRREPRP